MPTTAIRRTIDLLFYVRSERFERSRIACFCGMGMMCLTGFFWALLELLGSLTPREQTGFQTIWMRYGVHMLLMFGLLFPYKGRSFARPASLRVQILRASMMIGMPLCYLAAIGRVPLELTWMINWSSSLMVMAMAIFLLNETVDWKLWLLGIVGYVGVCMLIHPKVGGGFAILLSIGMALCSSVYKVMTRMMRSETTAANLFHTALWVFLPFTLLMPFMWRQPSAKELLLNIAIGLDGFLVLYCLDKAMEWAPAAITAPFLYTQNVFMVLFQALSTGTIPGGMTLAGVAVILVSCSLLVWREILKYRDLSVVPVCISPNVARRGS